MPWAVVSHSLNYKVNAEVSRKLLRQLARLSANLESVDEEFTILHEKIAPERAAESSAEVSQDNPSALLNLESLRECLNQNVDLQKWERFGVKAGMEPFPQLVSKYQTTGLQILLLTLQAVGIATIAEFESLLPEFEKVGEQLRRFVELVRAKDETLYAVPVDVLVLLVSFVKASVLPADFAWGEAYEPFFIEALRNVMTAKSKVTGRRGAGRRKKK